MSPLSISRFSRLWLAVCPSSAAALWSTYALFAVSADDDQRGGSFGSNGGRGAGIGMHGLRMDWQK